MDKKINQYHYLSITLNMDKFIFIIMKPKTQKKIEKNSIIKMKKSFFLGKVIQTEFLKKNWGI